MFLAHQQEEFSRACVHAVASAVGFKVQAGASPDDDSVDLTISDRGLRGAVRSPKIDVQLKCLMGGVRGADLPYPLKRKNYDDRCPPRVDFQVPRVLVRIREDG
ncbi:MAG: hypothetical protein AMXMBFR64_00240 [Myxococcales bacterium]